MVDWICRLLPMIGLRQVVHLLDRIGLGMLVVLARWRRLNLRLGMYLLLCGGRRLCMLVVYDDMYGWMYSLNELICVI